MSYLQMTKASLGDLNAAIISFWVKVGGLGGSGGGEITSGTFPKDFFPDHINTEVNDTDKIAFPGGSFWPDFPQFVVPHVWPYPPGDATLGANYETWRDNITPFITFGDPDLPYNRYEFKTTSLRKNMWVFGRGGKPQDVISQTLEPVAPYFGIVPPSMIGVYQGQLRVVLQTKNHPTNVKGLCWLQTRSEEIKIISPISCSDIIHYTHDCSEPEGWVDFSTRFPYPNQYLGGNFSYKDGSKEYLGMHPETFVWDTDFSVSDGAWHHVLISFSFEDIEKKAAQEAGEEVDGGTGGKIKAEATGPAGPYNQQTNDKIWNGTGQYGQWSGPNGEIALATGESRPYEDVGKYPPATGGYIKSTCSGWVAVDGRTKNGSSLAHGKSWDIAKARGWNGDFLASTNYIAPTQAFLVPNTEIRSNLTTNTTQWERDYRTALGGFNGPAAKISQTSEKRRYDYERPYYEFNPGSLPVSGHPIGIPAGIIMINANANIIMAEMQIWAGKHLDLNSDASIELFLKDGKPVHPRVAEEKLGKPHILLHKSGNWIRGINTGSGGNRETKDAMGETKQQPLTEGNFTPVGEISRYRPDPSLNASGAFGPRMMAAAKRRRG